MKNLRSIVNHIRLPVEPLLSTALAHHRDALVRQAVRPSIRASTNHLRHGSEVLEHLIENEGILIIGAEYSLESGIVEFLDGA